VPGFTAQDKFIPAKPSALIHLSKKDNKGKNTKYLKAVSDREQLFFINV
jgi:hypothetical protein